MHLADRNNPCGTKEKARDASDRLKIIPVEKKSKIRLLTIQVWHIVGQKKNGICATGCRTNSMGT